MRCCVPSQGGRLNQNHRHIRLLPELKIERRVVNCQPSGVWPDSYDRVGRAAGAQVRSGQVVNTAHIDMTVRFPTKSGVCVACWPLHQIAKAIVMHSSHSCAAAAVTIA